MAVFEESFDAETIGYAEDLIEGVLNNKEAIDAKIGAASRHWKVERMASVDRNVLRVAAFELKFAANPIKQNIVIDEAVEIARKFGTTESASFVNGVLDQIARVSNGAIAFESERPQPRPRVMGLAGRLKFEMVPALGLVSQLSNRQSPRPSCRHSPGSLRRNSE